MMDSNLRSARREGAHVSLNEEELSTDATLSELRSIEWTNAIVEKLRSEATLDVAIENRLCAKGCIFGH